MLSFEAMPTNAALVMASVAHLMKVKDGTHSRSKLQVPIGRSILVNKAMVGPEQAVKAERVCISLPRGQAKKANNHGAFGIQLKQDSFTHTFCKHDSRAGWVNVSTIDRELKRHSLSNTPVAALKADCEAVGSAGLEPHAP